MKPDLTAAKRGAAYVMTLIGVLVGSIGTLISVALVMWLATVASI